MRSSGHGALFVLGLTLATLACAAPAQPTGAAPDGVLDLEGRAVDPLDAPGATAVVLIFTRTDCPISNRYAPEVRRLYERFHDRGVRFWLVYPDPGIYDLTIKITVLMHYKLDDDRRLNTSVISIFRK